MPEELPCIASKGACTSSQPASPVHLMLGRTTVSRVDLGSHDTGHADADIQMPSTSEERLSLQRKAGRSVCYVLFILLGVP